MKPALSMALLALVWGCRSEPILSRPNVLLITADSLRADRFDPSEGGRTPSLARLARGGVRFARAYTVCPWTAPSLVSIFTGLYPPAHGVESRDDTTPKNLPTLPRILAAQGYTLANFGFFTEVSYYRNLGLPAQAVEGAEVVGSRVLVPWLATASEPFFAWIHLVEPHLPYGAGGYEAARVSIPGSSGLERAQLSATVPKGAGFTFETGDRQKLAALYDRDVTEMDHAIGGILDALDTRGLSGRTLVVFTADHGEELLDHGWVGHASTSGEAALTEEVLRVPLVFRGPHVPAGRVVEALAQNVDVTPTVLDLLGGRPRARGGGISLVPAFTGRNARARLFFDTVPGGHLTPESRRLEHLQGVSDGTRLQTERLGVAQVASDPVNPLLAADLAKWRREQARVRLRLLNAHPAETRPVPSVVEGWAESLDLLSPPEGARLEFRPEGGAIRLSWAGERHADASYWIEYEVGSGLLSAKGAFPVEQAVIAFGPFPVAFWNDLAGYSPFRFRVLDPSTHRRSVWRTFSLLRLP